MTRLKSVCTKKGSFFWFIKNSPIRSASSISIWSKDALPNPKSFKVFRENLRCDFHPIPSLNIKPLFEIEYYWIVNWREKIRQGFFGESDCNLGWHRDFANLVPNYVVTYFTTGAEKSRMIVCKRILTPQPQLGESFQRLVQRHIMWGTDTFFADLKLLRQKKTSKNGKLINYLNGIFVLPCLFPKVLNLYAKLSGLPVRSSWLNNSFATL